MSLLSELDGAELVVADEVIGLLFVWYGGATVNILDEEGNVLDAFSMSTGFERKLTAHDVYAAIQAHRQEMDEDHE